MATLEQLAEGIRRAHEAGNAEHVRKLGEAYRAMQAEGGDALADALAAGSAASQRLKGGPGESYDESMFAQTTSGLNEGIANVLGAPVEIANSLLNLGASGVNAVAGTDLKMGDRPIGGQQFFQDLMGASIKEQTDDPLKQGVRRVAEEVGAWSVPGLGLLGKSAKPISTGAKELTAALGSGTGAAVAQAAFPGNPWAEFAGQLAGGVTPAGLSRSLKGTGRKLSVDELRDAKDAVYKAADDSGVRYSAQAYDDLLAGIAQASMKDKFNPKRHAVAASVIEDMVADRGKALTMTELDQWRQIVRRELIDPSFRNPDAAADAHFGYIILDEIDDLIARAGAKDVVGGDPARGAELIRTARDLNTRLRKTEMVDDAIVKAERRVASTGSGGNINNAIRQNLRAILDSKKKSRAFTKEELAELERVVRQGRMEGILRWVGKVSPGGNGLNLMLHLLGAQVNPAWAGVAAIGAGSKFLADKGTINKAMNFRNRVAAGAPGAPEMPSYSLPLLTAQGANQL